MRRTILGLVLLGLACSSANAALLSRAGGLAYYDTTTNLLWVTDTNLARTSGYDADGAMMWTDALAWIASLNAQNSGLGYLGVTNWRLPAVTDTGTPGCNNAFTGTDCGYNVDLATGEMARMYYGTLGNSGGANTSGVNQPCFNGPVLFTCLANSGPFLGLGNSWFWYGTESALSSTDAWRFNFRIGFQRDYPKTNFFWAWAVRTGDIDGDSDGVSDANDNCTLVANPSQLDANGDGYGNNCDGDINNTGTVTTADFGLLRSVIGQPASFSPTAAAADMNGSGTVTTADFGMLRARLGTPPGPSGLACAGTVPCP